MKRKLWKGKADLASNLQREMPAMVHAWFAEGDAALLHPDQPYHVIHHFRLVTKRFRYTLEIFQPAYGPSLGRMIEELRQLQTLLGDLNDCVATSALLSNVPGSDPARVKLDRRAAKKAGDLRALWAKEFAPAARRTQWERYLVRYVCRATATAPPKAPEPVVTEAVAQPEPPESEASETPLYTES